MLPVRSAGRVLGGARGVSLPGQPDRVLAERALAARCKTRRRGRFRSRSHERGHVSRGRRDSLIRGAGVVLLSSHRVVNSMTPGGMADPGSEPVDVVVKVERVPPDLSETEAGYIAGLKARVAANSKVPQKKFETVGVGHSEANRRCRCVPRNRRKRRVSGATRISAPWPLPRLGPRRPCRPAVLS